MDQNPSKNNSPPTVSTHSRNFSPLNAFKSSDYYLGSIIHGISTHKR